MKRRAVWGVFILALVVATVFLLVRCGYIQSGLGFAGEDVEWGRPGGSSTNWA